MTLGNVGLCVYIVRVVSALLALSHSFNHNAVGRDEVAAGFVRNSEIKFGNFRQFKLIY